MSKTGESERNFEGKVSAPHCRLEITATPAPITLHARAGIAA